MIASGFQVHLVPVKAFCHSIYNLHSAAFGNLLSHLERCSPTAMLVSSKSLSREPDLRRILEASMRPKRLKVIPIECLASLQNVEDGASISSIRFTSIHVTEHSLTTSVCRDDRHFQGDHSPLDVSQTSGDCRCVPRWNSSAMAKMASYIIHALSRHESLDQMRSNKWSFQTSEK